MSTLESKSPICSAKYNSTNGLEVSIGLLCYKMIQNFVVKGMSTYEDLSSCPSLIQEACNYTQTEMEVTEVEKCEITMNEFRNKTQVK